MKKNTYTIPLALVFCLFFLWAISSNLLPTMIRQLMKTCELNTFEASFTETAYWLAYFIFPIPIAMFMKRYSYKAGIIFGLVLAAIGGLLVFIFSKLPKIGDEGETASSDKMTSSGKTKEGSQKEKLIDFGVLKHSHLRWGVIAQFFYNGGQTAINSLFLVYCCTYAGLPEDTATTFFGLYMLAFLLGRWIGTGLMVKFRPQDMLLVYALMNILLCGVVMIWGGMIGLYAMLAISFFMSIMYPTQFSLALKGLGNQTKSGSAFLVMAIVGNACLPQLTAYFMHANEHIYYMAYCVPMICFVFCAYYGWKGYKVSNESSSNCQSLRNEGG